MLTHRGRRDTRQQSGAAAPVASLGPLVGELERAGQEAEPSGSSLRDLDDDALAEALDSAGDARFAARTQGMRLELRRTPPDEVAHQAIMEGLGYASNRRPFRELGVRVPFAAAAGLKEEPAATRLAALRALLIGTAGFLGHEEVSHEARTLEAPLSDYVAKGPERLRRGSARADALLAVAHLPGQAVQPPDQAHPRRLAPDGPVLFLRAGQGPPGRRPDS